MFDVNERQYREEDVSTITSALALEEDLSAEIEAITKTRFNTLYTSDVFKRGNHTIEILYPTLGYLRNHSVTKGPNNVRFLLSLYPYASDLENVAKIILKPRYIEQDNIEIIALYLRNKKILVQYLHHPFYYETTAMKFLAYSEFIPIDLSRAHNTRLATQSQNLKTLHIPPLWYILSIIESSNEELIDKFFLRREVSADSRLIETSFYYSRHGY